MHLLMTPVVKNVLLQFVLISEHVVDLIYHCHKHDCMQST